MIKNNQTQFLIGISLMLISLITHAENKITIFAAASLTNALSEISTQYERVKSVKIVHSFAASSTLAKQIENGAPADIFVSADMKWMNYLQSQSLIDANSRQAFLTNKLVLIAPKNHHFNVVFNQSFDFAKAFDGKLCLGNVESVPAGIYAKQSLIHYNWWNNIKTRAVGTQDVRGALAFVERGECTAGIVYETDARASNKLAVIGVFPEGSHESILYPMALVKNVTVAGYNSAAINYLNYLTTDPALAIFKKYGFAIK